MIDPTNIGSLFLLDMFSVRVKASLNGSAFCRLYSVYHLHSIPYQKPEKKEIKKGEITLFHLSSLVLFHGFRSHQSYYPIWTSDCIRRSVRIGCSDFFSILLLF